MTEAKHGPDHERDTSGQAPIGQEKPAFTPGVVTPFDRQIALLQSWRDEDQGDSIWLSRHEVITLLEGVYALRSSRADMLAALKQLDAATRNGVLDDERRAEFNAAFKVARAAIAKAEGRTMTAQQTERTQV